VSNPALDSGASRPAARRWRGPALIIFLAILIVVLSLVFLVGATYRTAFIDVTVRERDGLDLSLKIPTLVVHSAIYLAPSEVWDEISDEADEWLPLVTAAQKELAKLPDCTLVEVSDRHDWVRIGKERNRIIIEVESRDEEVRVAVPLSTLSVALSRIKRAA
jgi:hypothetical protein